MQDLGETSKFLGKNIFRTTSCLIQLSHRRFTVCVLAYTAAFEAKKTHYLAVVGCLKYLALCARPDLAFSLCELFKDCLNSHEEHILAAMRALRYLSNTCNAYLLYSKSLSLDADFLASCHVGHKDAS